MSKKWQGIQVNKLCQVPYLEIRRIGSIRHYLSSEAIETLVFFLALSGLITVMLSLIKIQGVINCSARLICKAPKSAHITPLLYIGYQSE